MDYQEKYLKYKEKYLNLKKQVGAGTELDKIKNNKYIEAMVKPAIAALDSTRPNSSIQILNGPLKRIYDSDMLLEELKVLTDEEKIELRENKNLKALHNFIAKAIDKNVINESTKKDLATGLLELVQLVDNYGIIIKKPCTVEEYMTLDNPGQICNNPTLVNGSCGYPSFFNNIHTINEDNEKIVEFLDLIKINNIDKKTVNITLGSRNIRPRSGINITFDESASGEEIDKYIKELKERKISETYHLSATFPLNTDGSNKLVLDKVLEMTRDFEIFLSNKMCGSCFRSLYYLVQNANENFIYSVSPEQGLASADTDDIQKCFRK
jgi:hypothetical protein